MKDYYKILGVSSGASLNEIKQAFKKLAKQYHPDKNAGNKFYEEKFKEINEAYQILSDSSKKSKYDWSYAYQSTESYHSNYQSHNTSSQFRKSSAYSTGYTSHFYTNQEEEFSNTKSEKSKYTAWDNIKFYVISFALLVFIGTIGLLFGNFMNNYAADEHIKDGDKFYAAKLYIQAMNEYEAAIHFNEKDPRAYFGRANIKLNAQMDFVGAKYDYTTAIMLSDTINPVFLLQRAVCMYNLAQYRDAVYDLNSVLSFPEFVDGKNYYFRGMCFVKSHNKEQACSDFKKAFELKFQPAEDKIIEFCYYY